MGNKWCLSKLSVGLYIEQSGLLPRKSVKSTLGHNTIFCPPISYLAYNIPTTNHSDALIYDPLLFKDFKHTDN